MFKDKLYIPKFKKSTRVHNNSKKLSIQLNISDLDKNRVDELNELFKSHKGNHSLNFVIYDDEETIKLNLKSIKQKINISQELLYDLDSRKIFYKLN